MKKRGLAGRIAVHLTLFFLVAIWTLPTLGLFVSSLRDKDQLITSGWWTALSASSINESGRLGGKDAQVEEDGAFVIRGNLLDESKGSDVKTFSTNVRNPAEFSPGDTATTKQGELTVQADGSYEYVLEEPWERSRGQRVFYETEIPPSFSLQNYREVLAAEGVGQSFVNTLTVAIPSTIIPIAIAAFAAYAFSWMRFPGRQWLFATVVGLMVVPLQMSLIPLLRMYNGIGDIFDVPSKTYVGIWLAHTAFGLPLAVYLLRSYIASLPHEILESARMDGATHFQIFMKLILPLSIPALASFSIFQFLWVWNDLLVALVFLGKGDEQIVLTSKLRELLGSRGDNWEILTASAFVSILVPLMVFFSLQRFFVRGLLAGSVKGG